MDSSHEMFCANPTCRLHVSPADPNVEGRGDWAELEDGTILGRERVEGLFYCDVCADRRRRATGE